MIGQLRAEFEAEMHAEAYTIGFIEASIGELTAWDRCLLGGGDDVGEGLDHSRAGATDEAYPSGASYSPSPTMFCDTVLRPGPRRAMESA